MYHSLQHHFPPHLFLPCMGSDVYPCTHSDHSTPPDYSYSMHTGSVRHHSRYLPVWIWHWQGYNILPSGNTVPSEDRTALPYSGSGCAPVLHIWWYCRMHRIHSGWVHVTVHPPVEAPRFPSLRLLTVRADQPQSADIADYIAIGLLFGYCLPVLIVEEFHQLSVFLHLCTQSFCIIMVLLEASVCLCHLFQSSETVIEIRHLTIWEHISAVIVGIVLHLSDAVCYLCQTVAEVTAIWILPEMASRYCFFLLLIH